MLGLGALVVIAFATYRVARFVALDTLALPLRDRLWSFAYRDSSGEVRTPVPRAGWRTYVYDLVTCQHCLGVWLAIIGYCAWRWGGDVAHAILAVLAVAGAQSALVSAVKGDA